MSFFRDPYGKLDSLSVVLGALVVVIFVGVGIGLYFTFHPRPVNDICPDRCAERGLRWSGKVLMDGSVSCECEQERAR